MDEAGIVSDGWGLVAQTCAPEEYWGIAEEDVPQPVRDVIYANALAITALPDLLVALTDAECWLTAALECKSWSWDADQHEAATFSRDRARAAIAKALTGQSEAMQHGNSGMNPK